VSHTPVNNSKPLPSDVLLPSSKRWTGDPPDRCDLCKNQISCQFVDGKTKTGPWGVMCTVCFVTRGLGLGLGVGQHFILVDDGGRTGRFQGRFYQTETLNQETTHAHASKALGDALASFDEEDDSGVFNAVLDDLYDSDME
jgi:hypothetical protein